MSEAVLTLGPIVFQAFEIPSAIRFGGRQRLAVHRLSSGRRVTEALGPDDRSISFSGILSGSAASVRAHEIDMLRSIGQPLMMAWNAFIYPVVIQEFRAEYQNERWIPYRLACSVLVNASTSFQSDGLSALDAAIATVEVLYATVPVAALPIPDIRSRFSTVGNTRQLNEMATAMRASQAAIIRAGHAAATTTTAISLNPAMQSAQFLAELSVLSDAIYQLQNLAVAADFLGQSALHLNQAMSNE